MRFNTALQRRHIQTTDVALGMTEKQGEADGISYHSHYAACVKEFELAIERSGKLMRRCLAAFFVSKRRVGRSAFKVPFRHVTRHRLIGSFAVERWLHFCGNRNDTAHDNGERIVEAMLKLLSAFVVDGKPLADAIETTDNG